MRSTPSNSRRPRTPKGAALTCAAADRGTRADAVGSATISLRRAALPSSLAPVAKECSLSHGGREYQQSLAAELVESLEAPVPGRATRATESCTLVIVPTGGGKTHLALSAAKVLQDCTGMRVGWCAARRELLTQVASENQRFGFGVDLRLVSMFDRSPPPCDVLVMDEAHHDACVSAASVAAAMRPAHIIGLTATPYRCDRARMSYNSVLRRCSIQSLQDDGYLSQYRHVTIDSWEPTFVATTWLRDREAFGRTVIFFRTEAEGQRCIEALRAGGTACELVSGKTDRERQIADFASGHLEVLVAMGCLTEGFNDPALATVFVRPASRGPTVQMAGRVFRKHPETPIKTIVQCQRTPMAFPRLARPCEQFVIVDDSWRAIGFSRQLDSLVVGMRSLVASAAVDLPRVFTAGRLRQPVIQASDRSGRPQVERKNANIIKHKKN